MTLDKGVVANLANGRSRARSRQLRISVEQLLCPASVGQLRSLDL
jgi:hypothetical protein